MCRIELYDTHAQTRTHSQRERVCKYAHAAQKNDRLGGAAPDANVVNALRRGFGVERERVEPHRFDFYINCTILRECVRGGVGVGPNQSRGER